VVEEVSIVWALGLLSRMISFVALEMTSSREPSKKPTYTHCLFFPGCFWQGFQKYISSNGLCISSDRFLLVIHSDVDTCDMYK